MKNLALFLALAIFPITAFADSADVMPSMLSGSYQRGFNDAEDYYRNRQREADAIARQKANEAAAEEAQRAYNKALQDDIAREEAYEREYIRLHEKNSN